MLALPGNSLHHALSSDDALYKSNLDVRTRVILGVHFNRTLKSVSTLHHALSSDDALCKESNLDVRTRVILGVHLIGH